MTWLYQWASPKVFHRWTGYCLPWFWTIAIITGLLGLTTGLIFAPPDYQQGDAFRIMYIHVPCAALSMAVYMIISLFSIVSLIWRIKVADILAKVSAPLGAGFTFLALVTGSLWGKPMWGTWWIWDARLTSELILLFLYLGLIILRQSIPEADKASRACSILSIIGVVDIPIIHYSVYWWNTLHQQASVFQLAKPSIAPSMLYPLLLMLVAMFFYYLAILFTRARYELMQREHATQWLQQLLEVKNS